MLILSYTCYTTVGYEAERGGVSNYISSSRWVDRTPCIFKIFLWIHEWMRVPLTREALVTGGQPAPGLLWTRVLSVCLVLGTLWIRKLRLWWGQGQSVVGTRCIQHGDSSQCFTLQELQANFYHQIYLWLLQKDRHPRLLLCKYDIYFRH